MCNRSNRFLRGGIAWSVAASAILVLCPPAYAEKATLFVTKSQKAGTKRPTWFVSSRVRADIEEKHINEGTEPSDRIRKWVQLDVGCPVNDDAGHFIARVLGGTGTEHKNIFPENRTVNRGVQSQWEQRVQGYVVSGECTKARVAVSVAFDNNAKPNTRPVRIKYKVRCVGDVQPGGRKSLPTQNWPNPKPANCP